MMLKKNNITLDEYLKTNYEFICQSNLSVDKRSREWVLLPNKNKGNTIKIGWLFDSTSIPDDQKILIIDLLVSYSSSRSASTTSGIVNVLKLHTNSGFYSKEELIVIWSSLSVNHKKGLNQVFGWMSKNGYIEYKSHHQYTKTHLPADKNGDEYTDKIIPDEIYDQDTSQLNFDLTCALKQDMNLFADYFNGDNQATKFDRIKKYITRKIMYSLIRRPKQISIMKWSDFIPVGASFNHTLTKKIDVIGNIGQSSLQVRIHHVKQNKNIDNNRTTPEQSPLYLNEMFSAQILQYRDIYFNGIKILLNQLNINFSDADILEVFPSLPFIPAKSIFSHIYSSMDDIKLLFTESSNWGHQSDAIITQHFSVEHINNNGLRHTILTKSAQNGVPIEVMAKRTGVTIPAVRSYIDMDFDSRKLIDDNYLGNEFLKQAYNKPVLKINASDNLITDEYQLSLGKTHIKERCKSCSTKMSIPMGCYGCPNFIPLLEADHQSILDNAKFKLEINEMSILPLKNFESNKKLKKTIHYIEQTIIFCAEVILRKKGIK